MLDAKQALERVTEKLSDIRNMTARHADLLEEITRESEEMLTAFDQLLLDIDVVAESIEPSEIDTTDDPPRE
jgi:methyl-accepting chemotaxis protein